MSVEQLMHRLQNMQSERDALAERNRSLLAENGSLVEQKDELRSQLSDSEAKNQLHENEIEVLITRIHSLIRQLAEATRTDEQLALRFELNKVQRQLDRKNADLFVSKSERSPQDKPDKPDKPKKKGHGRRKQPELKTVEQLHLLDDADKICPKCGAELTAWGEHVEKSEEITVIRRKYEIIRHKRQKYKCAGGDCQHIETALGPTKLIPGGRYSTDFAISVAVDKYADHIPLARQVKRMKRASLQVTTATLWDQLQYLYVLLMPTLVALHEHVLDNDLVHADETTWPVIRPGKTKKWWVWSVRSADAVYFLILASRGKESARELLQNYDGILMADDYSVYRALEREKSRLGGVQQVVVDGVVIDKPTPDYLLSSCWAHIRRYFFKAHKSGDLRAAKALKLIGQMYGIEAELEEEASDLHGLLALREEHRPLRSGPLIDELSAWCGSVSTLTGTDLAVAIAHFQSVEARSRVFLSHPIVPLDNNPMERELRQLVVGRKRFHGSRSEEGTRVAAMFYALFSTCSVIGVDPYEYLHYAVHAIVKEPRSVCLPHDFKRVRDKIKDGDGVDQDSS
jgi:transposase